MGGLLLDATRRRAERRGPNGASLIAAKDTDLEVAGRSSPAPPD
jgi:hypothetical protein